MHRLMNNLLQSYMSGSFWIIFLSFIVITSVIIISIIVQSLFISKNNERAAIVGILGLIFFIVASQFVNFMDYKVADVNKHLATKEYKTDTLQNAEFLKKRNNQYIYRISTKYIPDDYIVKSSKVLKKGDNIKYKEYDTIIKFPSDVSAREFKY